MASWTWAWIGLAGLAFARGSTDDGIRWMGAGAERVCASTVPSAKKVRGKDRPIFEARANALADALGDPVALEALETAWAGVAEPPKPHPAFVSLDAALALSRGKAPDPALRLAADDEPRDACLQVLAAKSWLMDKPDKSDLRAARRVLGRAAIAAFGPDVAYELARVLRLSGELEAAGEVVAQGLRRGPDHAGLRTLRVLLASSDDPASVRIEELEALRDAGERDVEPMLAEAYYAAGEVADYLRVVDSLGAPLGAVSGQLQLADDPVSTLRSELGLSSSDDVLVAKIMTNKGTISCRLFLEEAPVTVANFVGLARGTQPWTDPRTGDAGRGALYDNTVFHRIIDGFMIQGGDPEGTGRGGPGYRFRDEIHRTARFDRPGLLAMANSGPATNGSQFFITAAPTRHLDGKHTIFGSCDDLDVVESMAGVRTGRNNRPVEAVRLRTVDVVTEPG